MNPETEDLISNGKFLRPGMKVLVASPHRRVADVTMGLSEGYHRALECNRWAVVSDIEFVDRELTMHFVATYDDGTKAVRQIGTENAWLVKKDSLKNDQEEHKKKYEQIYVLVRNALDERDTAENQSMLIDRVTCDIMKAVFPGWG